MLMSTKITVEFYIDPHSEYDADELVDMFLSSAFEAYPDLALDIELWEMVKEEFNVDYE